MKLLPFETYAGITAGIGTATILWLRIDEYTGIIIPADIAITYALGTLLAGLLVGLAVYVSFGGEMPE